MRDADQGDRAASDCRCGISRARAVVQVKRSSSGARRKKIRSPSASLGMTQKRTRGLFLDQPLLTGTKSRIFSFHFSPSAEPVLSEAEGGHPWPLARLASIKTPRAARVRARQRSAALTLSAGVTPALVEAVVAQPQRQQDKRPDDRFLRAADHPLR